jgi:hypothetical protein
MPHMNATQMAAWPQTQSSGLDDEELRRILTARYQGAQSRLAEMEAKFQELASAIERERQHIDHVVALLRDLGPGLETLPPAEVEEGGHPNNVQSSQSSNPAFTPGNRSSKVPPRRTEFARMSLTDAARQLLQSGRTMHTEELVGVIFDVQNVDQLRAAKATLRSTMAEGVKRNLWKLGPAPSTFQLI